MKTTFLAIAAATAAAIALPALAQSNGQGSGDSLANPGSAFEEARRGGWHAAVEKTERGYRIGNPDAKTELIEFISYTCPHCADFARQGEGALDMVAVGPGHMSLEIRPVIRNGIDLAVSMLVACGGKDDFKDRHRMYLAMQPTWLEKARNAPQSQQAIWMRGDRASRINVAQSLDLDDMLADRGVSRTDITACLSDDTAALALIRNGNADRAEFAVPGTPSFALDGELLEGVHSWQQLSPVLQAHFRPASAQE